MKIIRAILVLVFVVALAGLFGCSQPSTKDMQGLLDRISLAPEPDLPGLLYGYTQISPNAQKILLRTLRPWRAPSPDQHLTAKATHQSGRFTMVVVVVPWRRGHPNSLEPIIVTGEAGREQVVGSVLPFDDILALLSGSDRQSIDDLSQWWVQTYASKRQAGS